MPITLGHRAPSRVFNPWQYEEEENLQERATMIDDWAEGGIEETLKKITLKVCLVWGTKNRGI